MSTQKVAIGVLDIQGSVQEHCAMLKKIGIAARRVKLPADLDNVDGLIIPGGESTTIEKLLKSTRLDGIIKKRSAKKDFSIYGTCAGAILMAKLGLMDIDVERNAYGSQMDSFEVQLKVNGSFNNKPLRALFIRAPKIRRIGKAVCVLARYDGAPVMAQQNNLLVTTFHPELTGDTRIHEYFVRMAQRVKLGDAL